MCLPTRFSSHHRRVALPLVLALCAGFVPSVGQTFPVGNSEQARLPIIESHPQNTTVMEGQRATFTVKASGVNLTYQWYREGVLLESATAASYTTPPTTLKNNDDKYMVKVTGVTGDIFSDPALLTVTPLPPPVISGFEATPSVVTAGNGAILRWKVSGAISLMLNQGLGDVTGMSTKNTGAINADTTFTLTASNAKGLSVAASTVVRAVPAPSISLFKADPATIPVGGQSKLIATFTHGKGVITPGNLPIASGTPLMVSPSATTTYTLTVTNEVGSSVQATALVGVPLPGAFTPGPNMNGPRMNHTATLLPSGKVLIAGGRSSGSNSENLPPNAELYDPSTNTFTVINALNTSRLLHTATLLPNGKVLIAGGYGKQCSDLNSAELYDPSTGQFSDTCPMLQGRSHHTATLLKNGTVLFTGGSGGSGACSEAEVYDPATGAFSAVENMKEARFYHVATLLADGRVLITGGCRFTYSGLTSAEIYDPATKTFSLTGKMNINRSEHTATLLPGGKVLVAGGYQWSGNTGSPESSVEIYDPEQGSFKLLSVKMSASRAVHSGILLNNGLVLLAGHETTTDLFNPATRTFLQTGAMMSRRMFHGGTLLQDGRVLFTGGWDRVANWLASSELYLPRDVKPISPE